MTSNHMHNRNLMKIGIVSLGCPKNLVDSESMLGLLRDEGYTITADENAADIIIVNTCGFIGDAKKESIDTILEMSEKKSANCKYLIVTGCLAERYRDEFSKELPEVDAVLGTGEYGKICLTIKSLLRDGRPPEDIGQKIADCSDEQRLSHLCGKRMLSTGKGYAYLKIAEGCDNHCTYCVIPSLRGKYISRPIMEIVAEAKAITAEKEMELILVAQDTTLYGMDLPGGRDSFYQLIDALAAEEHVKWIRLLYCYPERIDQRMIDYFKRQPKVIPYLDIPIQHASDRILRKMGRPHDRKFLEKLVHALRSNIPDIILRTTVMTGFPGETEEDTAELLEFLNEMRFDRVGVFAYSKEEGTSAAKMMPQVPGKTARSRQKQIMRLQQDITLRSDRNRVGLVEDALIEEWIADPKPDARDGFFYRGRTFSEAPQIDGQVQIFSERRLQPGDFVTIQITEANRHGLKGEVLA